MPKTLREFIQQYQEARAGLLESTSNNAAVDEVELAWLSEWHDNCQNVIQHLRDKASQEIPLRPVESELLEAAVACQAAIYQRIQHITRQLAAEDHSKSTPAVHTALPPVATRQLAAEDHSKSTLVSHSQPPVKPKSIASDSQHAGIENTRPTEKSMKPVQKKPSPSGKHRPPRPGIGLMLALSGLVLFLALPLIIENIARSPQPTISPTSVDGDVGLSSPVITTNTPRLMPTPFTLVLREESVFYQEPRISAQPLFLAAPAGTPLRLVAVIQREDDIAPWFFITHDEYATNGAYIPAERNGRSLFEATPNPSQVEAVTTRSAPLPSSTPLVTVTASPTSAEALPPRLTVRYTLQTYTHPSRGTRTTEEVPTGAPLQPLERRTAEGVSWVRFEWNGSQRWLPVVDRNPDDTAWWRVFDEINPFE